MLSTRRIFLKLIPKNRRAGQRGASLLALSIFLIAAGIMTGGAINMYDIYRTRSAEDTTRQHLDVIETALEDFFKREGRFPCVASMTAAPDSEFFGTEVPVDELDVQYNGSQFDYLLNGVKRFDLPYEWDFPTICKNAVPDSYAGTYFKWGREQTLESTRVGTVPTRTLGIDDKYMLDGYGHRIVFALDTDTVDPDYWIESGDDPGSIYVIDDLTIKNDNPSDPTDDGDDSLKLYTNSDRSDLLEEGSVTTPAGGAIYVLIAPGQDPRGAYNLQGNKIQECELHSKAWENCDYTEEVSRPQITCKPLNQMNLIEYWINTLGYPGWKNCIFYDNKWENGDNVFINSPDKQYGTGTNDFTATLRYKGKFQKGGNE